MNAEKKRQTNILLGLKWTRNSRASSSCWHFLSFPLVHPLYDCDVNYSRLTRAVLPPLAKSGDGRRKSGPSPSATQTCCSNSSQEEDFHWPRCDFLYCTLIKSILFQRQCPTVVLWGHATKKINEKKWTVRLPNTDIVVLLRRSSSAICWRFHARRSLSPSNHSDSDKSVAFPLFFRCGNGYSSDQLASKYTT